MKIRKSCLTRMLTLALAVIMLVGVMTFGVSAATIDNAEHYGTYVCLGDSIAAGYGPYNKEIKGFARIEPAYHAIVADAVSADTFYPLARTGFRTTELRYMIDETYPGDDYLFKIYKMDPELRAQMRPEFAKALKEADLITLNVGSNDVLNFANVKASLATQSDSELYKLISQYMPDGITSIEQLNALLDAINSAGKMPEMALAFANGLAQGYRNFVENWDPIIRKIYEVNPDVTLVVVGTYNPMKTTKLTDASEVTIGRAFDTICRQLNTYMQHGSRYAGKYLYADVWDTEIYDLPAVTDETFLLNMMTNVHPTEAGHQYMAEQILKVLPERSDEPQPVKELPFKDVAKDWAYDDIFYAWEHGLMNGKDADIFDPDGTTTRAEFATVLYRLAGSPEVTAAQKEACPFADLAADWYRDAVIWAYDAKVVNGVSATEFAPNEKITREQLVTMLCRYCGETGAADLSRITDADTISDYAKPAVAWAVSNGIVSGFPDGSFQPKGNATRAQMAAIMARFDRAK